MTENLEKIRPEKLHPAEQTTGSSLVPTVDDYRAYSLKQKVAPGHKENCVDGIQITPLNYGNQYSYINEVHMRQQSRARMQGNQHSYVNELHVYHEINAGCRGNYPHPATVSRDGVKYGR